MNNCVTVVVMAHDRVETISDTIESLFLQKNIQIVVSDNSVTDSIKKHVKLNYPTIKYIRRKNYPDSSAHFNAILNSISSEYFIIFHDDDIFIENSIEKLFYAIEKDLEISAVSGNAFVMNGGVKSRKTLINKEYLPITINNQQELAEKYVFFDSPGAAPFPGYLYRASIVKGINSHVSEGGKHADVSFLMKVAALGKILWIDDCIMHYRIHGENDSSIENIGDRMSLIRYIKKNTKLKNKDFSHYKFSFYIHYLHQNFSFKKIISSYKYRAILMFIVKFGSLILTKSF